MNKEKTDRINELAKKSKTVGLTPQEVAEQAKLRDEYRAEFRASFSDIMQHTSIKYPDGTVVKVKEKVKHLRCVLKDSFKKR